MLALGIDIGTSGVCSTVLDGTGTARSMARAANVAQDPERIDAEGWWTTVCHRLRACPRSS